MKKWKKVNFDECRNCGNTLEAKTDNNKKGWFYECDEVRCTECAFKSAISVDEGVAYVL